MEHSAILNLFGLSKRRLSANLYELRGQFLERDLRQGQPQNLEQFSLWLIES